LEDFEAGWQPKMADGSAVAAVRAAMPVLAWPGAAMIERQPPGAPAQTIAVVSGAARAPVSRVLMSLQAKQAVVAAVGAASDVFQAWAPAPAAVAPIAIQPGQD
jgi:hypothetical protein